MDQYYPVLIDQEIEHNLMLIFHLPRLRSQVLQKYLSTFVRLGILIWAGGILTLNYVQFPGLSKQDNIDPTFIASVFTGTLATFGVEAGQRKKNAASGGGSANISKKDMEMLIEKATQAAPAQTIRIEQAPMVLAPSSTPKKG